MEQSGLLVQQYSQNPVNNFPMGNPTIKRYEGNSLCGDDITLYLSIEDNIITACSYDGNCSMITSAAAGFLSELIIGESIESVLRRNYDTLVQNGFEVSSRRKRAAVIAILAARNGIHVWRGEENIDTFDDLIPDY